MRALLTRLHHLPGRTLGALDVQAGDGRTYVLSTLELGHVDADGDGLTDRGVSRIPAGVYDVVPHDSAKYPGVWRLLGVPGRTAILIHGGNFPRHTRGCILVGLRHADVDGDGVVDVAASRAAVRLLREIIPARRFVLTVRDAEPVVRAERVPILPPEPL